MTAARDRSACGAAWAWLAVALAVRLLVALRTDVPERDAASYLWMAEHAAGGEPSALFATVFHPLHPALIALLLKLAPGLGLVPAGQLVACGTGALAVVPLFRLAERLFGRRAAHATALLYAFGTWFARHPAACMSEGPFLLLVAQATLWIVGERRLVLAGVLAGLAYATRPEGALLAAVGVAWLSARRNPAGAAGLALGALLAAGLVPLGYGHWGDGFTLTPKATFNWEVGAGRAAGSRVAFYLWNLVKLLPAACEGLGYAAVPLLAFGLVVGRPRSSRDARLVPLVPLVLLCLVIPLLRANERFVLGFGILVLPFAGAGLVALAGRLPARALPWLVALVVSCDLVRIPRAWQHERIVERELGAHLRASLSPGERVATEMPRLELFAGQKPGPPRPIAPAEILAAAASPATRFVVFVAARTPVDEWELGSLGFVPLPLDGRLGDLVHERGIRAFGRVPR